MQNFYLKSKEILKESLYFLLSYSYQPISIQECPGTSPLMHSVPHKVCIAYPISLKIRYFVLQRHS
jgi:hypothetical protein